MYNLNFHPAHYHYNIPSPAGIKIPSFGLNNHHAVTQASSSPTPNYSAQITKLNQELASVKGQIANLSSQINVMRQQKLAVTAPDQLQGVIHALQTQINGQAGVINGLAAQVGLLLAQNQAFQALLTNTQNDLATTRAELEKTRSFLSSLQAGV